jgi:hypothetical protein
LVLEETADEGETLTDSGDKETVIAVNPGEGISYFVCLLLRYFKRSETGGVL